MTRYSKNARAAATRRLTVDAAAVRRRSATTVPGLSAPSRRAPCQSTQANTSTGVTAASRRPCPIRNRARLTTLNA